MGEQTQTPTAYSIATAVGVHVASSTSPGAEFLIDCYEAAQEMETDEYEDGAHELADSLVPIYNSDIQATFADLNPFGDVSDSDIAEMAFEGSHSIINVMQAYLYDVACWVIEAFRSNDEEE